MDDGGVNMGGPANPGGTGMVAKKKKTTLPKGVSRKQFKERGEDAGSGNEGTTIDKRNAGELLPYAIKTTVPQVSNKPISFKR
jgi:hypothetical protein